MYNRTCTYVQEGEKQVTGKNEYKKTNKDPGGRRGAIIQTAAELIVSEGPANLTHRKVAKRADVPLGSTTYYFKSLKELRTEALTYLADCIDTELRSISEQVAVTDGDLATLVDVLYTYLNDHNQIRTDTALYIAATQQKELRSLALKWFNGILQILSKYTDRKKAKTIAIFIDGAIVHAMLHEEPLDRYFLESTLRNILQSDLIYEETRI